MWTILYKGAYIHGYCDKEECRINGVDKTFNSLLSAKRYVTKYARERGL